MPSVTRRALIQACGLTAAGAQSAIQNRAAEARPNIVIIHADQCRWDVVGAYGVNPMGLTPHLDDLARNGVLFENAVTNQPVCAPSRACLLTGQHANRHGVWRNALGLAPGSTTLATGLTSAGYTANYIGKWHLALTAKNLIPLAERGGFTGLWEAAQGLESTSGPFEGNLYGGEGEAIHFSGQYRVDFMTERAIRFLKQEHRSPFLLMVSYLEPHFQNNVNAAVAPKGYAARYANPFVPQDLRPFPGDWPSQLPDYYGCVASIDEAVGAIRRTLAEKGLDRNTIVVFLSDHGCHFRTRNTEYKRSAHESSIHVPLIMSGGSLPRNVRVREIVGMVDVAPTLLDASGVPVPSSMQGKSAVELARGKTDNWRNEALIQMSEFVVGRALRTDRWTYAVASPLRLPQKPVPQDEIYAIHRTYDVSGGATAAPFADRYVEYQMYDLAADPHQLVNLAGRAETREAAERLRASLRTHMAEVGDHPAQLDDAIFPYV